MKRAAVFMAIVALMVAPVTVLAAEPFSANLTPDEEPELPVPSDGSGLARVTINDDETEISFEVTFEGLTGPATMAHIHWLPSGAPAGPPILWLTPMDAPENESPLTGTLTEGDLQVVEGGPQTFAEALEAIRNGDTYVNVHTESNPAGEIRGQLEALPDTAVGADDTGVMSYAPSVFSITLALFGAIVLTFALRRAWGRAWI